MLINEYEILEANVDEQNVFRGVKILGQVSKNGHSYTEKVMEGALPMYEHVNVFLDHSKSSQRTYNELIGYIENPRYSNNAITGDFVLNPKHPMAESVLWNAKNKVSGVGFSHSIDGCINKNKIVESITKVYSVDLVVGPATTKSIFESIDENVVLQENVTSLKREITALKEENDKLKASLEEITNDVKKLKSKKPEAILPTVGSTQWTYETFMSKLKS